MTAIVGPVIKRRSFTCIKWISLPLPNLHSFGHSHCHLYEGGSDLCRDFGYKACANGCHVDYSVYWRCLEIIRNL